MSEGEGEKERKCSRKQQALVFQQRRDGNVRWSTAEDALSTSYKKRKILNFQLNIRGLNVSSKHVKYSLKSLRISDRIMMILEAFVLPEQR